MIGYMKPVKKWFSKDERQLYQSVYCGLCRHLKYEYGYTGMATLNYEVVNTLILIGAMAPSPYPEVIRSCSITPLYWRRMAGVNEESFASAAAVTIIAAAMELQDNLSDSARWYDHLLHSMIRPKAKKTLAMFRDDAEQLHASYAQFVDLERKAIAGDPTVSFQMLMDASGDIIAQAAFIIGSHADCDQLHELYEIMHLWGQWIYLIDAIDDYDKDKQHGQFNPLFLASAPTDVLLLPGQLEQQVKARLDRVILPNYHSTVYALFCTHMPHRRRAVINAIDTKTLGGCHCEPSIPLED